jgi:hypothetical protein
MGSRAPAGLPGVESAGAKVAYATIFVAATVAVAIFWNF